MQFNCEPDQRLLFSHMQKAGFSHVAALMLNKDADQTVHVVHIMHKVGFLIAKKDKSGNF